MIGSDFYEWMAKFTINSTFSVNLVRGEQQPLDRNGALKVHTK